jgi:hypothetical protein
MGPHHRVCTGALKEGTGVLVENGVHEVVRARVTDIEFDRGIQQREVDQFGFTKRPFLHRRRRSECLDPKFFDIPYRIDSKGLAPHSAELPPRKVGFTQLETGRTAIPAAGEQDALSRVGIRPATQKFVRRCLLQGIGHLSLTQMESRLVFQGQPDVVVRAVFSDQPQPSRRWGLRGGLL